MDAKASLIAIQKRFDAVCRGFPITLQQADIKEILDFQIAVFRNDKIEMVFEIGQRHGCAEQRQIRHGIFPAFGWMDLGG